jgi:hypothetical protein
LVVVDIDVLRCLNVDDLALLARRRRPTLNQIARFYKHLHLVRVQLQTLATRLEGAATFVLFSSRRRVDAVSFVDLANDSVRPFYFDLAIRIQVCGHLV